jgi:hypothetical protein
LSLVSHFEAEIAIENRLPGIVQMLAESIRTESELDSLRFTCYLEKEELPQQYEEMLHLFTRRVIKLIGVIIEAYYYPLYTKCYPIFS